MSEGEMMYCVAGEPERGHIPPADIAFAQWET